MFDSYLLIFNSCRTISLLLAQLYQKTFSPFPCFKNSNFHSNVYNNHPSYLYAGGIQMDKVKNPGKLKLSVLQISYLQTRQSNKRKRKESEAEIPQKKSFMQAASELCKSQIKVTKILIMSKIISENPKFLHFADYPTSAI